MVSHHRWRYPLACPNCGTTGQAAVSEESGPPFGDLPTRRYTISEGFRVRAERLASAAAQFECSKCGASAD